MELVKDIYFNTDKLVENTNVKVSYTGKFYQENNDKVFIHYGYGKNWNNVNDVEMVKTDLGYQTELNLTGGDTLNFCFKNQNNEWDNNCGNNYVFDIEKTTTTNLGTTTVGTPAETATGSFFGKTFGEGSEVIENSNVYWGSTTQEATSGVIEDTTINSTPNTIDAILESIQPVENAPVSALQDAIGIGTEISLDTPVSDILGVTPTLDTIAPTAENIIGTTPTSNSVTLDSGIPTNIINPTTAGNSNFTIINKAGTTNESPITALTVLANNGFEKTRIWTKKMVSQVRKFFAYVPKFISGNYKRNLTETKTDIKD